MSDMEKRTAYKGTNFGRTYIKKDIENMRECLCKMRAYAMLIESYSVDAIGTDTYCEAKLLVDYFKNFDRNFKQYIRDVEDSIEG